MTTPADIRSEVLTELQIAEAVLYEAGANRSAATDLARAVIAKLCDTTTDLSRREIAHFLKFRARQSIDTLIDALDAGDYDASPALPGGYASAQALTNTIAQALSEPEPFPS